MSTDSRDADDSELDLDLMDKVLLCANREDVLEEYGRVADGYDEYFFRCDYAGPRLVKEAILRLFPADGPIPREELKIIDICAGTGLVGQQLYDAGLRNVDALDASMHMVQLSSSRGVYKRVINDYLGGSKHGIADNTYDAVAMSGAFVKDHLPVTALDELIRICKPGGYIVNSMRFEYLVTVKEYHQLEPHMDRLESLGLWRRLDRYVTDRYFKHVKQGITYVYQKL